MKYIKRFLVWMKDSTPDKRKEQNWNRYFRGHIEVHELTRKQQLVPLKRYF